MGVCVGKPLDRKTSSFSSTPVSIFKNDSSFRNSFLTRNAIKTFVSELISKRDYMLKPVISLYDTLVSRDHQTVTEIDMDQLELDLTAIYQLRQILPYFINLQSLSFLNCRLKDQDLARLGECLQSLRQLRVLNLKGNQFTQLSISFFQKICFQLVYIQELNFGNNRLGDKGVRKIAELIPDMEYLEELNLDRNQIRSQGFKSVCSVLEQTSVRVLSVRFNIIQEKAIQACYLEIKRSSLQVLDIRGNYLKISEMFQDRFIIV